MSAPAWFVVDDVPGAEYGMRAIVDADGFTVCNPSPLGAANAALIVAAPDLAAALAWALDQIDDSLCPDFQAAQSAANAALARSRGAA